MVTYQVGTLRVSRSTLSRREGLPEVVVKPLPVGRLGIERKALSNYEVVQTVIRGWHCRRSRGVARPQEDNAHPETQPAHVAHCAAWLRPWHVVSGTDGGYRIAPTVAG